MIKISELENLAKERKTTLYKGTPASDEQISAMQKQLGLTLGEEYKQFLKNFGFLNAEYLEFYGICGENNAIPSAIFATLSMREKIPNFAKDLIVIGDVGDGNFYCIDCKDNVYYCQYDKVNRLNQTLGEFLAKEIQAL